MRIGMMADVYKPHVSGITNYIALYKRFLEQAGHEVFVFTFGDLGYADTEDHVLRSPGLPLVDTGYYLNFRYSRAGKSLLQTMDLVHVHHPFLSGRLALAYCRPLGIPIVFTNHTRYDLYAQAYLPRLPEELSETFLQSYLPPFCEAVDAVISPSAGMAQVLGRLGVKCPIEVVPNGVDLQRFHPLQDADACLRLEMGFQKQDVLWVYVGRLAPEKNVQFLIQAFSGVADALDRIQLLIIGTGPEEESLRNLVLQLNQNERVHFLGAVDHEALPKYLALCDVFVSASVTEVHPLSVIEALSAGLPVLGIQSVGVGDTVENEKTGFLTRQDPAAFTARMTQLCLDQRLRIELGKAARLSAEKYDIHRTSQMMLAIYERLIYKSGPPRRSVGARLRSRLGKLQP